MHVDFHRWRQLSANKGMNFDGELAALNYEIEKKTAVTARS